jgi:hypothetical protein
MKTVNLILKAIIIVTGSVTGSIVALAGIMGIILNLLGLDVYAFIPMFYHIWILEVSMLISGVFLVLSTIKFLLTLKDL